MKDKPTRSGLANAAVREAGTSRTPVAQATITLRMTRADTKPIERVKRWEARSAAKIRSLTD